MFTKKPEMPRASLSWRYSGNRQTSDIVTPLIRAYSDDLLAALTIYTLGALLRIAVPLTSRLEV
jgi:hypothetical protein